ncbi:hypothetical protein [Methylobacterium iners]|nr:hypothetical protein [Methylobacterium iners]
MALLTIDRANVISLTRDFDLRQTGLSAARAPSGFSPARENRLGL